MSSSDGTDIDSWAVAVARAACAAVISPGEMRRSDRLLRGRDGCPNASPYSKATPAAVRLVKHHLSVTIGLDVCLCKVVSCDKPSLSSLHA